MPKTLKMYLEVRIHQQTTLGLDQEAMWLRETLAVSTVEQQSKFQL